eukprot:4583052-Amphidinium_carterae.1
MRGSGTQVARRAAGIGDHLADCSSRCCGLLEAQHTHNARLSRLAKQKGTRLRDNFTEQKR